MSCRMNLQIIDWAMREPFRIARGSQTVATGLVATLSDDRGHAGRGEAYGVPYDGETAASLRDQLEEIRGDLEAGVSREDLAALLPAGGARCAIDTALWDLEAKSSGTPAWRTAGLSETGPVQTAFTIGIRSLEAMAAKAAEYAHFPLLKIKVDATAPLEAIRAVHEAAPNAQLIVDPNQAWSGDMLRELAPHLPALNVILLEQPVAAGEDELLRDYRCPVPICADEAVRDFGDIARAHGKYQAINIKLDKCGGLTEGLRMMRSVLDSGFRVMVGCMAGSSLAMAPAAILAQMADFVDLDGPLLQTGDWPNAIRYDRAWMSFPDAALWG